MVSLRICYSTQYPLVKLQPISFTLINFLCNRGNTSTTSCVHVPSWGLAENLLPQVRTVRGEVSWSPSSQGGRSERALSPGGRGMEEGSHVLYAQAGHGSLRGEPCAA